MTARLERLLERLGRCWPDGGPAGNPALAQAVAPYLAKLKEADRAVIKASLEARFADSRVTVLTRSVAKHSRRRDELAQQVLHTRFQAAAQRSASGEATLQRMAGVWQRELREFDDRFGDRPNELTDARRDAQTKRTRLRMLEKEISDLERTIAGFFPSVQPAIDREPGFVSAPVAGALQHLPAAARGDSYSANGTAGESSYGPPARVRAEYAGGNGRQAKGDRNTARDAAQPARVFRGGVVRARPR